MNKAIVVLGYKNDRLGNLLPIAKARCELAASLYRKNDHCKVMCTGGFGFQINPTKIAHGKYMQQYMQTLGVEKADFLRVPTSQFTIEDATLSKPIIDEQAIDHISLVTSDFHMKRASLIFNQIYPNMSFDFISAPTGVSTKAFFDLLEHEEKAIERERKHFGL